MVDEYVGLDTVVSNVEPSAFQRIAAAAQDVLDGTARKVLGPILSSALHAAKIKQALKYVRKYITDWD